MAEAKKQNNENQKEYKKNTIKLEDFWQKRLATTLSSKGEIKVKETIDNFCIILENLYKNTIFFNKLSKRVELLTKSGTKRPIETSDYDEIQRKIEKDFGIYDIKKTFSAIRTIAKKNSYHPIIDYLNSLKWDGINRIDTAFSTYLGANEENNEYNGMCLRLFLFGAIERVFTPRC